MCKALNYVPCYNVRQNQTRPLFPWSINSCLGEKNEMWKGEDRVTGGKATFCRLEDSPRLCYSSTAYELILNPQWAVQGKSFRWISIFTENVTSKTFPKKKVVTTFYRNWRLITVCPHFTELPSHSFSSPVDKGSPFSRCIMSTQLSKAFIKRSPVCWGGSTLIKEKNSFVLFPHHFLSA